MIRLNAEVPDDFEEYCEISFLDPSDKNCRIAINLARVVQYNKL
jgi:hypothetical protein